MISNLISILSLLSFKMLCYHFYWFFKHHSVPFFFPHSFFVVEVNYDTQRIPIIEFEYLYLSTLIGKPLKHEKGFQTKNSIVGFLCLRMVCYLLPDVAFFFYTICLMVLRMDSNWALNPDNRLLITWINMTYQINDWYLPYIHLRNCGPW